MEESDRLWYGERMFLISKFRPLPAVRIASSLLVGRLFLIALAVSCSAGAVYAQSSDLVTDRPDFSESTETVAPGEFQVESGYTFTDGGGVESHALGEVLVRIGLNERTELRLGLPSYLVTDIPGGDVSGFGDPSIGFKLKLNGPPATQLALTVSTTLTAGSSEFRAGDPQPRVAVAAGWNLPGDLSLGANLGYSYLSGGADQFGEISGSLAVSGSVGGQGSAFVEVFGFAPESSGGDDTSFLGTGFLWRPSKSKDVQLDVRAGAGLNSASADFYFGFGAAWRR